ncbi:MAG: MBL fold metallo-hydrolase [Siculibacillus sp.]|nr:MBL fold metallo-hydrolase [Siculibacillus sp.]
MRLPTPPRRLLAALAILTLFAAAPLRAETLRPVRVAEGIHALVGEKGQRSPTNLGNNATFGVIVTADGVVLVDPGGSRAGAAAIDAAIATLTDAPVKIVIDTGGQDHRWLGNGYWRQKGARIVAAEAAVADQRARAADQIAGAKQLLGDAFAGTEPVFADTTFASELTLELGGVRILVRRVGPAHTAGDTIVWLADRGVVFTGDVVYVERLLGVGPQSNSKSWIEAFDAIAELGPRHVVPGHGGPTDPARARAETRAYLVHLRREVEALLARGGTLVDAPKIDQSAFSGLEQFDSLAARNASQVFIEMEMD